MMQHRIVSLYSPALKLGIRSLSMTTPLSLIQKWRKERGLPLNPNTCGMLTDGPDYTFLDGRLTPYGMHQKTRILKQKELLQDIIKFTGEIDFAVERHKQLRIAEENKKNEILGKKLKPKGLALLKAK
ncbi:39S ribosomal protein L52, mitochondrial [Anoplophora glabripennis]|nr:39S ribosomal protein L52, mitochondrial [Anoplophora glabripennis]